MRAETGGNEPTLSNQRPATSEVAGDEPRRRRRPLGKPEQLLKAIVVFNLFDALMTLVWIRAGRATEANPLMRDLVENHPVLFVAVKLALVSLGCVLLWRYQRLPSAIAGTIVLFFAFYAVLVLHFNYLGFLIHFATG